MKRREKEKREYELRREEEEKESDTSLIPVVTPLVVQDEFQEMRVQLVPLGMRDLRG